MYFANHMDSRKIVFSVGNQLQTNYHSMSFPGSVWDRHACPTAWDKCNVSLKGLWQTLGENQTPLKLVTKHAEILVWLRLF